MSNDGFKRQLAEMQTRFDVMKNELPEKVANTALNHFMRSFAQQGFDDNGVIPWKEVQRRTPGYKAYLYPKKKALSRRTRPILFGTKTKRGSGRELFNSVRNGLREQSWLNGVRIVSDLPYSKRHNEGLNGMPKRQFMGRSYSLRNKLRALQRAAIRNVMTGRQ